MRCVYLLSLAVFAIFCTLTHNTCAAQEEVIGILSPNQTEEPCPVETVILADGSRIIVSRPVVQNITPATAVPTMTVLTQAPQAEPIIVSGTTDVPPTIIVTPEELQALQGDKPLSDSINVAPNAQPSLQPTPAMPEAPTPAPTPASMASPDLTSPDGRHALVPGNDLWVAFVDLIRQSAKSEAEAAAARQEVAAQAQLREAALAAVQAELQQAKAAFKAQHELLIEEQQQLAQAKQQVTEALAEISKSHKELTSELKKFANQKNEQSKSNAEVQKLKRELAEEKKYASELADELKKLRETLKDKRKD